MFIKHYAPNHMLASKDDFSKNVLARKGYNSNVLDGQTDILFTRLFLYKMPLSEKGK